MNGSYFVKRFGYMLLTLWIVITTSFFLFRLLPGDPVSMMIDPLVVDPVRRTELMEQLGLNQPLPIQ